VLILDEDLELSQLGYLSPNIFARAQIFAQAKYG